MLSTCSDPMSNSAFVTSATSWLSRTPGFSRSAMSWYAPSTIAQAMFSSMISSADLTSRASSIVCWPSRTVMFSASSAASIGGSTRSTPIGMSATPSARRISAISLAAPVKRPASGATAPRSPIIPPRMFSGGSHGQYSRWCLAADPKSQRCGSPPRVRSAKRVILSRAHSPMWVLVTYRMLLKSKSSSAPSSEASSASRARPNR